MCRVRGQLCRCLWKDCAQAVKGRALMLRVAYAIGVLPRAEKVDPHLGFLCNPPVMFFFGWAGRVLRRVPRIPSREGWWARSVRSEV